MISLFLIIAILLVLIGGYLIYKKNPNKGWRKFLGIFLIAAGIIFIEPTPDPITLSAYAITHGLQFSSITLETFSTIVWQFEIWTLAVGLILLVSGALVLGWNLKRLWNKLNIERYWLAFFFAIVIVITIAWIDVQGMIYWASFSTTDAYLNGQQGAAFWTFFKSIVFVIFAILPIAYYFLYRKDKSEAISLFASEWILWMFGFADLMFFVLSKQLLPTTLVWLNNHPIIGGIAHTLGYENVTSGTLLFSVVVGFVLAYLVAKLLKEKF
jgi:hypothetical protein